MCPNKKLPSTFFLRRHRVDIEQTNALPAKNKAGLGMSNIKPHFAARPLSLGYAT
jgi:hypothetical protein